MIAVAPTERFSRRQLLRRGAVASLALATTLDKTPTVEAAARPVPRRAGVFVDRLNALQSAFRSPIGNWQAGDIPHAYALPNKTTLWILNDSFLSTSPNGPIDATSLFVRNTALLESEQSKLTMLESRHSYLDDGEQLLDRWWWFHGGHVVGRRLHVVTTEMLRTQALGWAINFEPASTWITTIDWPTARIVKMQPAPNNGVTPVYGFSIASDQAWTYLYGNNHLYGRSTTENRVARVPRGRILSNPTYWDGETWTSDPSEASSILTYGTYACRLHVFRHGPRWLATAKEDEFYGTDILIFEAPAPTGPWNIIQRYTPPTKTGDDQTCTYDAMACTLTPDALVLWWSNNAYDEALVRAQPSVYRPSFARLPVLFSGS